MSDFLEKIRALSPKQLMLLALEQHERLESATRHEPIAIIGMACRFPGADTPEAFWRLLDEGRTAIREVPADRWDSATLFDADRDAPGRIAVRAAGFLDDIAGFDAAFFGIAPREAASMDPQQRLLLEVAWEALENAGVPPDQLANTATGVFVGQCNADYLQRLLWRGDAAIDGYLASGTSPSVTSGRLAYCLGLRGPALTVDTSCSASLVALHLACRSLRAQETRVALAAGVNLICAPEASIAMSKAHMLAADGHSKAFDAAADGLGRGEGVAVLVLKRLSDALADGDQVQALVRGSAINQDGRSAGLTVPSGPAQEAVIAAALADAGVPAHAIGYVEAHGTGTALGDPIEVRALSNALGRGRHKSAPLLIGSVKSNIGHLEGAAGIAGVIKTVLCLQHARIVPQPLFKTPNPHIPWDEIPIAVAAAGTAWPADHAGAARATRLAGVSSFGFSGTNAHVVLEQAPTDAPPTNDSTARSVDCLVLSTRSPNSLRELALRYADLLEQGAAPAEVARAAALGRTHLALRLAVVAQSGATAAEALRAFAAGRPHEALLAGPSQADEAAAGASGAAGVVPAAVRDHGGVQAPLGRVLAEKFVAGASVDWRALGSARGTTRLPNYPFDHQRFWVDAARPVANVAMADGGLFYEVQWKELSAVSQAQLNSSARAPTVARRFTLVGDVDGLAAPLAERLRTRGDVVTVCDVEAEGTAFDGGDLVYLAALSLDQASAEACSELACAAPVRWLARFGRELEAAAPGRAWLVTAGAQAVQGRVTSAGRFQAPLWGVGRVFALEQPMRWGGLVDLCPKAALADRLDALLFVLDGSGEEEQIAWRDGRIFAPRLERSQGPGTRALKLDSAATYLVVGGFGGLGLLVGRWLAEQGARHVALLGRTPDMNCDGVAAIRAAGARVIPLAGDVADVVRLSAVLDGLAREAPPLKGIFHAATAVSVVPIADLNDSQVAAMLRPKVAGLLALQRVAPAVDFTVLFSSTAALTGAMGMAHYAAANAFLDASAQHADGGVLAVNWGTWEVMRAATAAERAVLRETGFNDLDTARALEAMGRLIAQGARQMAVANIDWSLLKPLYERSRPRPLLKNLAATTAAPRIAAQSGPTLRADAAGAVLRTPPTGAPSPALPDLMSPLPVADRAEFLETWVRDKIAGTLGLSDPSRVTPGVGLFDLGMDSLMAVSLQRQLEQAVGRSLPATLTFNHPNARALARYLATVLGESCVTTDAATDTAPAMEMRDAEIDAMTDTEIEAQLRARLEQVG